MFPSEPDLETRVTLETERTGVIDEPPFRILMLGDWSGDAEKPDPERRRPLEIDRDNFDDIMKKLRVRLDLEAEGGNLQLEFQSLDDFHPDELFKQVPMFAACAIYGGGLIMKARSIPHRVRFANGQKSRA